MTLRLLTLCTALCGLLLSFDSTPAQAQNRLHLILAGDETHPELGPQAMRNQELLEMMFQDMVSARQLQIVWLSSFLTEEEEKCSPETLKRAFDALTKGHSENDERGNPYWEVQPVQDGDAVLLYVFSQGSYNIPLSEHSLIFSGGTLTRTQLEIQLISTFKQARLIVLLTETFPEEAPTGEVSFDQFISAQDPTKRVTAPVINSLFFQAQGFANINSSDWAQTPLMNSFFKETSGDDRTASREAPFTTQFCLTLQEERENAKLNWKTFHKRLAKGTNTLFAESFPTGKEIISLSGERLLQQSQDPIFLGDLPHRPGEISQAKPRMGVSVQENEDREVVIVRLDENAPASKCWDDRREIVKLEPETIVLEVNAKAIQSTDDFIEAIGRSPREAMLKVRTPDGKELQLTCRLRE